MYSRKLLADLGEATAIMNLVRTGKVAALRISKSPAVGQCYVAKMSAEIHQEVKKSGGNSFITAL